MAPTLRRLAVPVLAGISLATVGLVLLVSWNVTAHFTPDSYGIFEMSRTAFSDPGRVTTVRQYHLPPFDRASAFPPLQPFLVALVNAWVPCGLYAGVVVAVGALCLLPLPLLGVARNVLGPAPWPLAVVTSSLWLAAVMDPYLRDEALAGRAIPLGLLLMTTALWVATSPWTGSPRRRAALLGGLMGLACMARFAALPFALALTVVVPLLSPARRVSATAAFLAALVATCSPWMIHSERSFGVPWATDHARLARSAVAMHVAELHPDAPTWRDEPAAFGRRLASNASATLSTFDNEAGHRPSFVLALTLLAALAAIATLGPRAPARPPAQAQAQALRALALVALASPALLLGPVAIGFLEPRYFSVPFLLLELLAVCLLLLGLPRLVPGPRPRRALLILLLAGAVADVLYTGAELRQAWLRMSARGGVPVGLLALPLDVDLLRGRGYEAAASAMGPGAVLLDTVSAFRFGALSGVTTIRRPRNWHLVSGPVRRAFWERFRVTHVRLPRGYAPASLGLPLQTTWVAELDDGSSIVRCELAASADTP